ncbi:MAG: sigma 54-interacting transcriptional regulator [Planctomycetota bacterium]
MTSVPAEDAAGGSDAPGSEEPTESASHWSAFLASLDRIAAAGAQSPTAPTTVLLQGESGAGKSWAARRLHDRSPRSEGPFIDLHLAGLAPTLLEAELFGHAEGAFTGAARARSGRFERADGGTIVLESIETLDLSLQVKLLRVLQERVVEPLGAETPVPIDVRVVATTARDLRTAVEEGAFREDLYFRLAVVALDVPPLRARAAAPGFDDLCRAVIERVAARSGAAARPLSGDALAALAAHPWPGNLRELENALERVSVLGPTEAPVTAQELAFLSEPLRGRAEELAAEALASGVEIDALDGALLDEALRLERGNVSAAARRIGLSRRAFDYRRKRLGSPEAEERS